ncbi:MAG: preprotein translocase subunit SecE [Candidatus Pacebacteria bacterium]|nr:preprotein translocase subunit SecE [Candidatus Paceibacterota bacterium]
MSRFINYLKDTKAELQHVSWPTQTQAVVYTALVIIISIVIAAFLGALDYVFTTGLDWFLK